LRLPKKALSVGKDGAWEHCDGILRMVRSSGVVLSSIEPYEHAESLGEAVEAWNYLKYPNFKPTSLNAIILNPDAPDVNLKNIACQKCKNKANCILKSSKSRKKISIPRVAKN
jgi:coenzyme F420-reducing hydrogenase alpha subunit